MRLAARCRCNDGDWFGRPVIEAARLCAAAASSGILVSGVVQSVVGTRGGYRFADVGKLSLKGLGPAVNAFAVLWQDNASPRRAHLVSSEVLRVARNRRRTRVGLGMVVLLAVASLAVWRSGSGESPARRASAPRGYTPRLERTSRDPSLIADEPDAYCADLVVPETRTDPAGRQLRLEVRRVPALDAGNRDESTISIGLEAPADELSNSSVRKWGDHITLATRGSRGSSPSMQCPELNRQSGLDLAFAPVDGRRAEERRRVVLECHDKLVEAGFDLGAYGSRDAALDVRDLAVALELKSFNLQAGLTDTREAREVAVSAPGVLRSLVLQDVQPPDVSAIDGAIVTATDSLDRYEVECAASTNCAALSPDLRASLVATYSRLDEDPVDVLVADPANRGRELHVLVDGDRVVKTLVDGLGDSLALPLLAATIADPDLDLVAGYAALRNSMPDGFPNAARVARYCLDKAPKANRLLQQASMETAPMFRVIELEPARAPGGPSRGGELHLFDSTDSVRSGLSDAR